MSAAVYTLRPFQTARYCAQRAGVPVDIAMRRIREAQEHGESGREIAHEYQTLLRRCHDVPGDAA